MACRMYSVNALAVGTTVVACLHTRLLISLGQISSSGIMTSKKHTFKIFAEQAVLPVRKAVLIYTPTSSD